MKIKLLIFFTVLTLINQESIAQAKILLEKTSHDFGQILEGDPATVEFSIKNEGTSPLIISKVQPACGCTTPDWTRDPIKPGEKGYIKASYGTSGRVGFFNKSITIYSNDESGTTHTLSIRGNVVKKVESKYSNDELRASPKIVLTKDEFNFGKVEKGARIPFKLEVKNLGRSDLLIDQIIASCTCVKAEILPDYIKVGETVTIDLIYTPLYMGQLEEIVYISCNDITKASHSFKIKANLVESLNTNTIIKENQSFIPFK
jgi:hypothetical protein